MVLTPRLLSFFPIFQLFFTKSVTYCTLKSVWHVCKIISECVSITLDDKWSCWTIFHFLVTSTDTGYKRRNAVDVVWHGLVQAGRKFSCSWRDDHRDPVSSFLLEPRRGRPRRLRLDRVCTVGNTSGECALGLCVVVETWMGCPSHFWR